MSIYRQHKIGPSFHTFLDLSLHVINLTIKGLKYNPISTTYIVIA